MENINEYESLLIKNENKSKHSKKLILFTIIKIFVSFIIGFLLSYIIFEIIFDSQETSEYLKIDISENLNKDNNTTFNNNNFLNNENLYDFTPVSTNGKKGPITIDRVKSNGYKENIYEIVSENLNNEFESFYYDYESFNKLNETLKKDDEYFCEIKNPSEGLKGYYLTCPTHYTIVIDNSFYGRYGEDKERCTKDLDGNPAPSNKTNINDTCGIITTSIVNKLCKGKVICNLKPNSQFFTNICENIIKYLHIKYHCKKDLKLKKPKIAIVTFVNEIEVNSIYEHAISDLYQYSDIHGYKLIVNRYKYIKERDIQYMKSYVILDAITNGLKTKEYDWVFWMDADCIIANPNIKVESFIPIDNKIHLVAASDQNRFNAGVLLFRVHEWSMNILNRIISFAYYNKNKFLYYADQASWNNVLTGKIDEKDHYVIVPQSWFNNYPDNMNPGDFIIHFSDFLNKTKAMENVLDKIKKTAKYTTSKTNKDIRKEVLKYYNLPKNKQLNIKYNKTFKKKNKNKNGKN